MTDSAPSIREAALEAIVSYSLELPMPFVCLSELEVAAESALPETAIPAASLLARYKSDQDRLG